MIVNRDLDRIDDIRRKRAAIQRKGGWKEERETMHIKDSVINPADIKTAESPSNQTEMIPDTDNGIASAVPVSKEKGKISMAFIKRREYALSVPYADTPETFSFESPPILRTTKYFSAPIQILNPVVELCIIKPIVGDKGLSNVDMQNIRDLRCPQLSDGPPHLHCSLFTRAIMSPDDAMKSDGDSVLPQVCNVRVQNRFAPLISETLKRQDLLAEVLIPPQSVSYFL
jgi:hypothetical protein